ncbi:hypothetical protein Kalk_10665 [Ketobacter alkanivorans]|uniref:Uncharacterized protein n=2 Tax=Ketobacter alkanivorans TaxID=1917421 RepID=A0A2K9LPU5_9GAMM|nr:hypothetical protein Kalk_10665 [Ketobacter alkanivorans]
MRLLVPVVAMLSAVLATESVWAKEMPRTKLSLGYFAVMKADTYILATEREAGAGVSVNPADTFGTDLEQSVFRFDGKYRINSEHAMSLTWYRISSRGVNTLDQDVEWIDSDGNEYTISAGASVDTDLDYNIFKLSYLWSFYHNDKVELYTSAGIHGTTFEVDLDVENNVGASSTQEARRMSSTIPLPNFGLGVQYSITPKLSWFLQADLFAMRYEDWSGSFSDLQFAIEYQVLDYLGLGIGVGSTGLNITETTDTYRFAYENKLSGVNFYLTSAF